MLTLKSEFAEIPQYIAKPEEKKDINIKEFKQLIKESLKDGINSEELNNLNDEINSIEGKTRDSLQNLLNNIISIDIKDTGITNIVGYETEEKFNMFDGINKQPNPSAPQPNPSAPQSTIEKKKESPEKWIARKYNTPQKLLELKSNLGLGKKANNSDLVKAVKKFQKENGLIQDGKPGTNTIKMIKELVKKASDKMDKAIKAVETQSLRPEFEAFIKREFKGSRNPSKYSSSIKEHLSAYSAPKNIMNYRVKMDDGSISDLRLTEKEATHYNDLVDYYNIKVGKERKDLKEKQAKERDERGQKNLDKIKNFFGLGEREKGSESTEDISLSDDNNESKKRSFATKEEFDDMLKVFNLEGLIGDKLEARKKYIKAINLPLDGARGYKTRNVIRDNETVKVRLNDNQKKDWKNVVEEAKSKLK